MKDARYIDLIPATEDPKKNKPSTHIRVSVDYDEGGTNWYSGGQRARGIHIYATPVSRDGIFESCILGQGLKSMILPMTRRNTKKQAALTVEAFADLDARRGEAWKLVLAVCARYGLVLAPTEAEIRADHVAAAVVAGEVLAG